MLLNAAIAVLARPGHHHRGMGWKRGQCLSGMKGGRREMCIEEPRIWRHRWVDEESSPLAQPPDRFGRSLWTFTVDSDSVRFSTRRSGCCDTKGRGTRLLCRNPMVPLPAHAHSSPPQPTTPRPHSRGTGTCQFCSRLSFACPGAVPRYASHPCPCPYRLNRAPQPRHLGREIINI